METTRADLEEAVAGCIVGMAVGDAIGLPLERLSRRRQERRAPGPLKHALIAGRGLVSDDTEHAIMAAQSVIVSGGDPDLFVRSLSWRMRFWLLGVPAGIGRATLQAVFKLWLAFPWDRSGVYSAGNGPAMRSPVLGVLFAHDPDRCRELVYRSTRVTHADPKAFAAALAVAIAARMSCQGDADADVYFQHCRSELLNVESGMLELVAEVVNSVRAGEATGDFAAAMGLEKGVTGYSYHTVPVALHAWLSHPRDYRRALDAIIRCGGDTDTTAAIVGGIVGGAVGVGGIPEDWRSGLVEWPCNVPWMVRLGERAGGVARSGIPQRALGFNVPGQLLRNFAFLLIVLVHGFRRMLPP